MATKSVKKTKPVQCKLGEQIREHLAAKKAIEKQPKRPAGPMSKVSYTVAEWNQYQKDLKDYTLKLAQYEEHKKALADRLEITRKAIASYLPKAYTWFITEDKRFAVALQGSDWPGDVLRVIYRENPVIDELPKLSIQIIN